MRPPAHPTRAPRRHPAAAPRRALRTGALITGALLIAGLGSGCSLALDLEGPPRTVGALDASQDREDAGAFDRGRAPEVGLVDATPSTDGPSTDGPTDAGEARDLDLPFDDAQPRLDLAADRGPPADAEVVAPDADRPDQDPPPILESVIRYDGPAGLDLDGVRWDASGAVPTGDGPGRIRSAPLRAPDGERWTWLDHRPELPYGTPLLGPEEDGPDLAAAFPGLAVGGEGLRLLLHLEDPVEPDAFVRDSGPEVTQGFFRNLVAPAEGVFGQAAFLPGSAAVHLDPTGRAFRFGAGDFTWSLFARTEGCPGNNNVYLGGERAGGGTVHAWLGCYTNDNACPLGNGLGGVVRASRGAAASACAAARFDDGDWHHLAMVKRGHNPARVTWYLDGAEVAQSAAVDMGDQTIDFDASRPFFGVGNFPSGQYHAHGAVDEVAIWHRALRETELASLSDRGLARITLSARRCAVAGCPGDPPFERLDWQEGPEPGWRRSRLPAGLGGFVQFEVVLDRAAGPGPRLHTLRLTAE